MVRRLLARCVRALTGRTLVLLPAEAADDARVLSVAGTYRMSGDVVRLQIDEARTGQLQWEVLGYEGHTPQIVLASGAVTYHAPMSLTYDASNGQVAIGDITVVGMPLAPGARRVALRLTLRTTEGTWVRHTSHYRAGGEAAIDAAYFSGANYVAYEAQSVAERAEVLALLRAHHAGAKVLEIGAATGGLIATLRSAGFDATGVDISEWAVAESAKRLGPGHVLHMQAEGDALPEAVRGRAPFDTLVLWATFEHFRDPFATLARFTPMLAPGARLFIRTTNADSLTHRIFGNDWEGFHDWTHHGVTQVSARSMREQLPAVGWDIVHLSTDHLWDSCLEPTHDTLRQWHAADHRFRTLLAERELGDFLTVVAQRR
jgi:2-polyprenyl-3-methyl-5-hydroxy-6-metoxy-1,4-benzoquinol methylase